MSLVWALGKNTSPGRQVGVNPELTYLVDVCLEEYSACDRFKLLHMASSLPLSFKHLKSVRVNLQALSGLLFW